MVSQSAFQFRSLRFGEKRRVWLSRTDVRTCVGRSSFLATNRDWLLVAIRIQITDLIYQFDDALQFLSDHFGENVFRGSENTINAILHLL